MQDSNDIDKTLNELACEWLLKEISLPIRLKDNSQPIIFSMLNDLLVRKHERKELLLPNFEGAETVAIFSDYGGESSNSKYFTYTFTFVDYNSLGIFSQGMKEIRERYGLTNPFKEISFKDLHYGPIKRCLEEYLNFSNNSINGLIFTLIVDKKIISLSGQNNKQALDYIRRELKENGMGDWKGNVAEKHQRVVQVIAYFSKLLIGNNKKIFWMTDHDNIVANKEKAEAAAQILVNAISTCKDANTYKTIGYSPRPFEKDDNLYFTDILSISDLVAGSVEHYFTRKDTLDDFTVKESADKVLQWLSVQGIGLKKLTMKICDDNGISGGFVDFLLKQPLSNSKYVDIIYDMSLKSD